MKRKMKAEEFAVGDVVVHHCRSCHCPGFVGDIMGEHPVLVNTLIVRELLSTDPNWGECETTDWSADNLTPLESPLALAQRYCRYREEAE